MTKEFENNDRLGNCMTKKVRRPLLLTDQRIRNEPTVSPFAQAHAMKCMRTRYSYKACDRRVHALQTDWTCGKFV